MRMKVFKTPLAALLCAASAVFSQTYSLKLPVTGGFKIPSPVYVTHAGDPAVIYVLRQQGLLHAVRVTGTTFKSRAMLDLRSKVTTDMEGGLIGLAFHPDFSHNRKLYVSYTVGKQYTDSYMNFLSEFTAVAADPDSVDAKSERVLISFPHPWPYHHMSSLNFGPDGYLYVGLGDGGTPTDAQGNYLDIKLNQNAQDLSQFKGGLLRLDVDHPAAGKPYGIPADNPLVGNTKGYKEEKWAWGVRYPWRFSIDRATGEIWAGNVGQSWYEEVLKIEKGKNYGWPRTEGDTCIFENYCDSAFAKEEYAVHRSGKGFAIIGGYVYRGGAMPELQGTYVYGDYVSGQIWGLKKNASGVYENKPLVKANGKVVSFGEDAAGNVYVTTFGSDNVWMLWSDKAATAASPLDAGGWRVAESRPWRAVYSLPSRARVRAGVYALDGASVKGLVDEERGAGQGEVRWDGTDAAGRDVRTGIYLVKARLGGAQRVEKVFVR